MVLVRAPALATPEENAVYAFCRELHETRAIGDSNQPRSALGQQAVIELTVLSGYYTTVSMILDVFEVPLPEGVTPPLGPLSGT